MLERYERSDHSDLAKFDKTDRAAYIRRSLD
jgi:hypothetical protein